MQPLILLPFLVASVLAGDLLATHAAIEPAPQLTHEQNTATGEYGYSYSGGPSAKTEFRALDGTTTGTYSYVDAHGILQTVNYIADEFGFRAAGSNIPSDGHQRKKRGILPTLAYHAAPVALEVPLATSSQSHVQIHHKSAPILAAHPLVHSPLLRKKRGIFAYAAPPAPALVSTYTAHAVPLATSSQSHFQVHKSAKLQEVAATPIIEAKAAIVPAPIVKTVVHQPVAVSSQSRFQIHKDAKIIQEVHQPIYAAAAILPTHTYHHEAIVPAAVPAPAAPISDAASISGDGDSVTIESARWPPCRFFCE